MCPSISALQQVSKASSGFGIEIAPDSLLLPGPGPKGDFARLLRRWLEVQQAQVDSLCMGLIEILLTIRLLFLTIGALKGLRPSYRPR
jgi:hypothetical protein